MADYRTPGVYIEEKNAFSSSVVAVETAIPVFIGHTEIATRNGKSLNMIPTRVTSFSEYTEMFGGAHKHLFTVAADEAKGEFTINNKKSTIAALKTYRLYNSIRLFYSNGGADCFIVSIGDYNKDVSFDDAIKADIWTALEKEYEPTLVVIPDALALIDNSEDYTPFYALYTSVLQHCSKVQSRFGIFDVPVKTNVDQDNVDDFRENIGTSALNYAAAYYPWLNTAIVQATEVDFLNLAQTTAVAASSSSPALIAIAKILNSLASLEAIGLPEQQARDAIAAQRKFYEEALGIIGGKAVDDATTTQAVKDYATMALAINYSSAPDMYADGSPEKNTMDGDKKFVDAAKAAVGAGEKYFSNHQANVTLHQSLLATSPTYISIMNEIRAQLNRMAPSAAMAGIYTKVDNSRGVWKAPANESVNMVSSPTSNITSEQQANFNVDPVSGKSINIIRPFRGIGTLVWGARTLDGNSQDWRYINVRRTLIMLEQSIKLAMRAYVFEPNTANTWITVQSMITNFLTNVWKQGALAGAAPEQAFQVQIGLGTTMTPNDVLDGKMLVTIRVAISHPAEFIVLTFQQMQQIS